MKKFAVTAAIVLVSLLSSSAASAHDPIIVTDDQTSPDLGPFLPDGTISFALYGSVTDIGDTRSFRVQFVEGDRLHVSLLIPDLEPENTLSDDQLPTLELVDPNGVVRRLVPDRRIAFAEPFTGTNYVELVDHIDTARSGTYVVTVVGNGPARFTVSVGDKETFGTPVEGVTDRSVGIGGVMEWYSTAPEITSTTVIPSTSSPMSSMVAPATVPPSTAVPASQDSEEIDANDFPTLLVVALVLVAGLLAVGVVGMRRRRTP